MRKPGKRIDLQKLTAKTKDSIQTFETLGRQIVNKQVTLNSPRSSNIGKSVTEQDPATGVVTDRTQPHTLQQLGNDSPFKKWLHENCVARIKKAIRNGTHTVLNIAGTPSQKGTKDYAIRKGDTFYVYDSQTYKHIKLTAQSDLLSTSTTLSTNSFTIKHQQHFASASYILPDFNIITERASNSIQMKRFDVTNAQYKTLNNSPFELLPATTGVLHMPISCYIVLNYASDEMVNADAYIGHNRSTTIGEYWGSIDRFAYRSRYSQLFQIGASTYGAGSSLEFSRTPIKSGQNNGVGLALELITTSNFTNPGNTLTILLYYKSIYI